MTTDAIVDVKEVVKLYGPLRAVDGISFQVKRGEIVGLLGANGAGKSTLMKVLTCYVVADRGSATVAGVSIDSDPVGVRRHIGYLPENAPLYNEMMVRDFLLFVARIRGLAKAKARERIEWAVKACGLEPKFMATIGTLSRGYRQRVGIAQAILHDPDLLILDEPTSGLDPIQIIDIRRLIMEIGKTKTVFFSTHIMQEVEAVCNRAIIIAKGKLVADGSPADLKMKFAEKGRLVAKIRGAAEADVRAALKDLPGVGKVHAITHAELGVVECHLHLKDGAAANEAGEKFYAAARAGKWSVVELRTEGVSMEDAFLKASMGVYGKEATA
ncbi:MAG: ATP-binding cassette domain-containing protein [Planctomycetota bacterium]|nr:ATP-binding cassette domain-containing protein [Planctomycetota bacterium]